jgi:hypothetical protein
MRSDVSQPPNSRVGDALEEAGMAGFKGLEALSQSSNGQQGSPDRRVYTSDDDEAENWEDMEQPGDLLDVTVRWPRNESARVGDEQE